MAKVVEVTSAQVRAAQTAARRAEERGEEVPASIRRIAGATRRDSAAVPSPDDSNAGNIERRHGARVRTDSGQAPSPIAIPHVTEAKTVFHEIEAHHILAEWLAMYPRTAGDQVRQVIDRFFATIPALFPNQIEAFFLARMHESRLELDLRSEEAIRISAIDNEHRELAKLELAYDAGSTQFHEPRIAITTPGGWLEISPESLSESTLSPERHREPS